MNDLYTIKQVAEKLQVHVNTVYNYINNGQLNAIKLAKGGRWRITKDELDRFIGVRIAEAQGGES